MVGEGRGDACTQLARQQEPLLLHFTRPKCLLLFFWAHIDGQVNAIHADDFKHFVVPLNRGRERAGQGIDILVQVLVLLI